MQRFLETPMDDLSSGMDANTRKPHTRRSFIGAVGAAIGIPALATTCGGATPGRSLEVESTRKSRGGASLVLSNRALEPVYAIELVHAGHVELAHGPCSQNCADAFCRPHNRECLEDLRCTQAIQRKTHRMLSRLWAGKGQQIGTSELVALSRTFRGSTTADLADPGRKRTEGEAHQIYNGMTLPPRKIASVVRPTSKRRPDPVTA